MEALEKNGELSSAELAKATGLWSGTLYPMLETLEIEGQIYSYWEEGEYPRRRIYGITLQ